MWRLNANNKNIFSRDVKFGIQIGSAIGPKWDKTGTFKISFSTFWLDEQKCTETDLKKSEICPIWGKILPICDQPWHSDKTEQRHYFPINRYITLYTRPIYSKSSSQRGDVLLKPGVSDSVATWLSGKLPFECQKNAKNWHFFQKIFNYLKKYAIGNFVDKN